MKNTLIMGNTGCGKSRYIHALLGGELDPAMNRDVGFIVVEPKGIEYRNYTSSNLTYIVPEPEDAAAMAKAAMSILLQRYKKVVVIIDELWFHDLDVLVHLMAIAGRPDVCIVVATQNDVEGTCLFDEVVTLFDNV